VDFPIDVTKGRKSAARANIDFGDCSKLDPFGTSCDNRKHAKQLREPSAAQPQPKLAISPAKTPRPQRSETNGEKLSEEYLSFSSELRATIASLREEYPNLRIFESQKICASCANFELL
jgi:hypothetical protein